MKVVIKGLVLTVSKKYISREVLKKKRSLADTKQENFIPRVDDNLFKSKSTR